MEESGRLLVAKCSSYMEQGSERARSHPVVEDSTVEMAKKLEASEG